MSSPSPEAPPRGAKPSEVAAAGPAEPYDDAMMTWTRTATHLCLRARSTIRGTSTQTRARFRHILCKARGKSIVHFLHIGKCGGSAVKAALRSHLNDGEFAIFLQAHAVTLRLVPEGEKVFFFLRDPISRFVSAFYSRQRQGMPRYHIPWSPNEAIAFSRFETPNQLATALASTDANVRQQATDAMLSIRHVKDSFYRWFDDDAYFLSRLDDIVFIGFQEQLGHDFEEVKRVLRLPESVGLPAGDTAAHRNPSTVDKRIDEVALAGLRAWYARDLRFYDLCKRIRLATIIRILIFVCNDLSGELWDSIISATLP